MAAINILLADNDPDFLVVCAEFLESAGYRVLTATTPSEALRLVNTRHLHLIVLDLRLMNDLDEKDRSGLMLAKELAPSIPKLILTKFPTYQDVRDAMKLGHAGLPPAVDFLNKLDGLKKLQEVVSQTLAQYAQTNWNLIIQASERNPLTFPNLVTQLDPALQGERLLIQAEELEDLFRRLFYGKSQIRMDRLLWQHAGRVAVSVSAFAEGQAPESLIVVCGQKARVMGEARRYREHAPKAPGPNATVLIISSETMHFAANAYTLAGAKLENLHSLVELYRSGPDKAFTAALKTLYEKTLADWYQENRIPEEHRTLADLYRERLGLKADRASQSAFKARVQSLVRQIPTLGVGIESASGELTINFGEQSFSYLDPTALLYQAFDIGRPTLLINTSGGLAGETILSNAEDRVWITDFAGAGLAPLLWNFVTLEAAIRFDWIEASKLRWVHDMEQHLLTADLNKLNTSDIEAPLRKPLRAIHAIRMLAAKTAGKDPRPYNLGIVFHAASRLLEFNPALRLTPNELARLAHLLMATAMLCGHLSKNEPGPALRGEPEEVGIRIDKINREVWVNGALVSLQGHSYDLLCHFYDHPNQLRTRRELIEQVFGEKYDEMDDSQISRLNMAIYRLREKIGDSLENPRYLLPQCGGGYRLILAPRA